MISLESYTTGDTNPKSASAKKTKNPAKQLYQAILKKYTDRDLAVDIASEELLLISSHYKKLSSDLRRRFISQVLVMKAGITLNMTAEYQRGSLVKDEQQWRLIGEDDPLKKQAKRKKVELGRAIERAFHR